MSALFTATAVSLAVHDGWIEFDVDGFGVTGLAGANFLVFRVLGVQFPASITDAGLQYSLVLRRRVVLEDFRSRWD